MNKKISVLLLITALALSVVNAADTVLLNDTFTDGTVNGWAVIGGGGTLAVQDDTAGIGAGNALKLTTSSNNRYAQKSFDAITLGINDTITLTMTYRFITTVPTVSSLTLRFVNSAVTNYMGIVINPGSAAANQNTFNRTGDSNEGKFTGFIHDLTSETVTLTVTRVLNGADAQAKYNIAWAGNPAGPFAGGMTSVVPDPAAEFKFDALWVGFTGTTTDGLYLDNIAVSTSASTASKPVLRLISFTSN